MEYDQYLIQRIREGGTRPKARPEQSREVFKKSVLLQLQDMFNVRQGSCLANPDFGLPDLNDLDAKEGFATAISDLSKAIKNQIETFAPGLTRVRVKYVRDENDPLNIQFEIVARLNIAGKVERIRFETRSEGNGSFKVMS
ncbi:type VI secretion system baseplate subunit TssE [Aestuariibacter salexigens]|uniref:type VI secretion system baseplate subunit TssE n=1 Tax=Aestuariibacter salexigens TaxID=226010 RepID=UPI0004168F9D|nr:type VI secretion system baseplate subunit TssE [Aestuariibacter salexigens]